MINTDGLESIRTSLAADGYEINVNEEGERVGVVIAAGPEAKKRLIFNKMRPNRSLDSMPPRQRPRNVTPIRYTPATTTASGPRRFRSRSKPPAAVRGPHR